MGIRTRKKFRSYGVPTIASVAVIVVLSPLASRSLGDTHPNRPVLALRSTIFTLPYSFDPLSPAGRLIPVFGSLPPRALCRNAHWQWEDLSQQWFAGADCTDAQLQSAKLIGTNFRGANLSGAQMQDAMMWFVDLDSARLQKANLRHADLARGSLRQASLEGADLRRTVLKAANLTQANLLGAKMTNANLTGANLQNAILTGLVMDGVDFTRANLSGADLSRADLRNAVGLSPAQLKLANIDAETRLPAGMSVLLDAPAGR